MIAATEAAYVTRIKAEFAELDLKIDKLDRFIGYEPTYQELPPVEQTLLVAQRDAMRAYASILQGRINLNEQG